jgi:hypothetical protein
MPRAARKARPSKGAQLGLALAEPSAQVHALGRERARLLKEITRHKESLLRIQREMEAASDQVATAVGPIIEQQGRVELEIHALFAALLAPGRLAKRKRAQVKKVYATLQATGLIGRDPTGALHDDSGNRAEDEHFDEIFEGGFAEERVPGPTEVPGGRSANKPPDDIKHRSLRALFKRLVVALHPDRASHEDEKARRTAAMKDLTHAYEQGDLARMIELGDSLSAGTPLGRSSDASAVAVQALERLVVELKAQLRQLVGELRDIRRSERFLAVKDLAGSRKSGSDPLARLQAEEQSRLDDLVAARDFVSSFEAGKLGLRAFLDGPSFPSDTGEDIAVVFEEFVNRMLEEIEVEVARPRPRRRGGRKGRDEPIPY